MRVFGFIARLVTNVLNLLPYWVSWLVPRDQRTWVFGSWFGLRYSDNSRYVFEHVNAHHPEVRAIWLTRDRQVRDRVRAAGYRVHMTRSLAGFWVGCRAGLAVLTCGEADVNVPALSRSRRLMLFHGTPLKRIKADDTINENRPRSRWTRAARAMYRAVFPFLRERWDFVVSPAPGISPRLASAFRVPPGAVVVTGSPRGDVILRDPPQSVDAIERLRTSGGFRRFVLYAPTHRREGAGGAQLMSGLDERRMTAVLERFEAALLIKTHFYHRRAAGSTSGEGGRLHHLTESDAPDINVLLPFVDVLITDYSSVFYDYLLLDRPILFAPFDLDDYRRGDRDLYEDYNEATPGPKCLTWEAVADELERTLAGPDAYASARATVRARAIAHVDTGNCERVVRLAKQAVGARE